MKHSPTPWTLDEEALAGVCGCRNLVDAEGNELAGTHGLADDSEDMANAQFIVTAVNAHDVLVAALKKILATKPQHGMNPNAVVGSPYAIGWNVHDVAREALTAAGVA